MKRALSKSRKKTGENDKRKERDNEQKPVRIHGRESMVYSNMEDETKYRLFPFGSPSLCSIYDNHLLVENAEIVHIYAMNSSLTTHYKAIASVANKSNAANRSPENRKKPSLNG